MKLQRSLPAAAVTFTQANESYKTAYVMACIRISHMDSQIAPAIRHAIVGKIEQSKANIIIDMTQVDTIATASLAAFLEFKYRLATHQRRLLLAAPGPEVVQALRVTRMESLLTCTESIEAAIQALAD